MSFPITIEHALQEYDRRKGPRRRLFGDHPAIAALNQLPLQHRNDINRIMNCFSQHPTRQGHLSHKVYLAAVEVQQQRSDIMLSLAISTTILSMRESLFSNEFEQSNQDIQSIIQGILRLSSNIENNSLRILQTTASFSPFHPENQSMHSPEESPPNLHANRLRALESTPVLKQVGYFTPEVPDEWLCPITRAILSEPVSSGAPESKYFYEKYYLKKWYNESETDPMTRFETSQVIEAPHIKQQIEDFLTAKEQEKQAAVDKLHQSSQRQTLFGARKFQDQTPIDPYHPGAMVVYSPS